MKSNKAALLIVALFFTGKLFADINLTAEQMALMTKEVYPKASSILKQILIQYKEAPSAAFTTHIPFTQLVDGKLAVSITTYFEGSQILDSLIAEGLEQAAQVNKSISGWLPLDKIEAVLENPDVRFLDATMAITKVGLVTTQGDINMHTDTARVNFNVDGKGIKIGTISDSFDALGGAQLDVITNDLPKGVVELPPIQTGGTDEGRAMMQIIHDIAPGAKLFFRTRGAGEADMATGIMQLINAGMDIINDDVLFLNEPMFQDGIIAQAVDFASRNGIPYFSAAGNLDEDSYQAPFRNSGLAPPVAVSGPTLTGVAHNFNPSGPADIEQLFMIAPDDTFTLVFQYAQPFVSACGGDNCPGPTSNLEIGLFDPISMTYVAISNIDNIATGTPLQIFSYTNTTGVTQNLDLVISKTVGPDPVLIKYVVVTGQQPSEFNTMSSSSWGHDNATTAISIASAAFFNLPPFSSVGFVNPDSSLGGTPIFFGLNNVLLPDAPVIRMHPNVTGPDCVNNTFFGEDLPEDPDQFPNFCGTSAATPHVAGLAALILQSSKQPISPALMRTILESTTLAIVTDPPSPPGFNFKSGFGLVQADGPDGAICGDIDHDGVCLNADFCPENEQKTCECSGGINTCQETGNGFINAGIAGSPSGGRGRFSPVSEIFISPPMPIPPAIDAQGIVPAEESAEMPEPVLEDEPPTTKVAKKEAASCSTFDSAQQSGFWGIILMCFWLRCRLFKRRGASA